MKKGLVCSVGFALATLFHGGAEAASFEMTVGKAESLKANMVDFISIQEMSEDDLRDFFLGRLQNIAIEFPANSELPLSVSLDGDVISLLKADQNLLSIQFNKTVYLKVSSQGLLFSTDLKLWRPFSSFVTGKLQIGLEKDEKEGALITLGAELFEQKN